MTVKINFITACNPQNAYSGITYICEELVTFGYDVELFCQMPGEGTYEDNQRNFKVNNICDKPWGRIPKLRAVFYYFLVVMLFIRGDRRFIFHELHFFRLIALFKLLSKTTKCAHYATELYDEHDVPEHKRLLAYYRKNADLPDLVIECEDNRAAYRRAQYGLKTPICIIPNTLPMSATINTLDFPEFIHEIGARNIEGRPVIVYSGGGYIHRELDRIIDGVALSSRQVFLLLACYGPQSELAAVSEYAHSRLGPSNYLFVKNARREEVIGALQFADAGIVYYRPSVSIGNRYAAPTKFYEYVAAGLPVVSSPNDSLLPIIKRYDLGRVTSDETREAIGRAIDLIFESDEDHELRRERIRRAFKRYLCFDVAAQDGMRSINELFSGLN